MKWILSGVLALLAVSGCATHGGAAPGKSASAYCEEFDCAKMGRVSHAARRGGNLVIWVNPPRKSS